MTPTNQNYIHQKIKGRLKLVNGWYCSVQNLSHLLSKNAKIKLYKITISSVILYKCIIWSLTLRGKQRLRTFINSVQGGIFRSIKKDVIRGWRKIED
jgi:hypothetical protein